MTDLLAIGTRKGLWFARSDDDRRTWAVDGPHLLAQEVAAVCVPEGRPRPPRPVRGERDPSRSPHYGRPLDPSISGGAS